MMHVQRALACANRTAPTKTSELIMQLDVVPFPRSMVPGGRLDVAGVSFIVPATAIPGTSLCVALPLHR